jgi:Fe-S cluster assembly iron-binding protein IscA
MIRLTERAATGLRDFLAAQRAQGDQAVKLVPDPSGGIAMTIDRPGYGDAVIDGDKRPLLIVDSALAPQLEDVTLDLTKGNGLPPHFVFVRGEKRR